MKPSLLVFFLEIVLALSLAACSGTDTPSGPPEKLVIAEASQPVFALVYVAEANGYLKEAGLDVTFNSFPLGRDALTSVIDGRADIATVYETPVILRLYEGKPLGILSTLHSSTRNTSIVARRDRGIEKPADLRGKRIGVTPGTSTAYFVPLFLTTEGILPDSVTIVPVEPVDFTKALLAGDVDAVALFSQHSAAAKSALGERAVEFHSDTYMEFSMLVGMRDKIVARPEAARRLLRAILRAQDYVEANREASIAIVVRKLAGKVAEQAIRDTWGNFTPAAKIDNVMLSAMTLEARWLKENRGLSSAAPDIRAAIQPATLRAVRPGAVTIDTLPERH